MTSDNGPTWLSKRKGADPGRVADAVARNPERIASIFEGLNAKEAERFLQKHKKEMS